MNDDSSIFPEKTVFSGQATVQHPQDYVRYSHFIFLGVGVPSRTKMKSGGTL
jgi:hypothetical protein